MKRITVAVVLGVLSAIQAGAESLARIKDSVKQLGWSWWVLLKIAVVAGALAVCGYALWQSMHPAEAAKADSAGVVKAMPREAIVAPVRVLPAKAKAALHLPKEVQRSAGAVVLDATALPKSKHERTVSSVLDTTTGEVTSYVEEKPLPWLATAHSGSVALAAGFKNLEPAIRAEVRKDFITVKAVTVGGVVSADYMPISGKTDTFVAVQARYEW